jgi:hypothetical protein
VYDVETGGNVTGTSMRMGDLGVSDLAWFNPSPDAPAPFLAVGEPGGSVMVYDGGSGRRVTAYKATESDGDQDLASMTVYHNGEGLARLVVADKNSIVHVSGRNDMNASRCSAGS